MTHSTIDCVALAIRTPVGVIIHTGDFKIDPTPVDGKPFDLHAFARYGQEGVLALFSDSTNVERPGFTPSERAVVVRLEELFRAAPQKRGGFLLFEFDPSHPAGDRRRAHRRARKSALSGAAWSTTSKLRTAWENCGSPMACIVRPQDIRSFDRETAGDPGERHAGRADVFALADRGGQSPAAQHRRKRHGDSFGAHYSRKRKSHFPHDRPPVPPARAGVLRRRARSADPRFGACQPGRDENPAATGEAEIFHSGARRVPAPLPARRAGRAGGRGCGTDFSGGKGTAVEFTADGRAFRREPVPAGRVWWIPARWRKSKTW